MESIDIQAFYFAHLYDISLNDQLAGIGKQAFYYAKVKNSALRLPDSVKEIQDEAFSEVSSEDELGSEIYGFKEIVLPQNLKALGKRVFSAYYFQDSIEQCQLPVQITINGKLEELNVKAFRGLHLQ